MNFSQFNLDPRLQSGAQRMGFRQPTPIQAATIPVALTGQDILGSAETGTGKTAAYLLPILHRLLNSAAPARQPRALIVVPTRELALQVAAQAQQLGRLTKLRLVTIYGGVGFNEQTKALKQGVDIVIATPGRLLDHAARGHVDLSALAVLVLDEADRMLDVGFLPDLRRIVKLLPTERQTLLFSATLATDIVALAAEVTRQPKRIQVEQTVSPQTIRQTLYPVSEQQKLQLLQTLLQDEAEMQSVLVFARTKHRADRLTKQLRAADIHASVIHGNRSQGQRVAALEAFRRGKTRVLVATDIAARGLDVVGVSHVINYDLPMQLEDYVHRIGRTGRAQSSGSAYTLVTPHDEEMVRKIEQLLKKKLERRHVSGFSMPAPIQPQPARRSMRQSARPTMAQRNRSGAQRSTLSAKRSAWR